MFRREVLRRDLRNGKFSAIDSGHRLIAVTDAIINYGDALISGNMPGANFVGERNAMYGAYRKNPNSFERWNSYAFLRVVCPDTTIIVASNMFYEPQTVIDQQTALAKSTQTAQPIGCLAVKFIGVTDTEIKKIVRAERVLNVAFSPHKGPLDEFSLHVFEDAGINYVGEVDEGSADNVLSMLQERFDELLTPV